MAPTQRRVIGCNVAGLPSTAEAVDQLARLQLAAHRAHGQIQLRNLSPELDQLLRFAGLSAVLPAAGQQNEHGKLQARP